MHFSALITIDALKQNLRHKYKNKLLLTNSSVLFTLSLKISYWFWHCFWCSSTHYFRPRFRWFWINIRFYIDSSNIRYSGYRPSSNFWYNIWRSNCFCSPNIRYNFRSNCYIHSSSIWQYFRCSSLGFIKFIWSNNNKAKLFGTQAGTTTGAFSTPASGTTNLFGGTVTTQTPSLFGGVAATTTAAPSLFGTQTTAPSLFGSSFGTATTTAAPSLFGGTSTTGFGTLFAGTTTTSAPSLFGGFGASTTTTQSGFGGFGAPGFSGFGGTSTAPNLFGPKPPQTTSNCYFIYFC